MNLLSVYLAFIFERGNCAETVVFEWVTAVIERLGYGGVALLTFLENLFPPIPSVLIIPLSGFVAAKGQLRLAIVIAAGTAGSLLGRSGAAMVCTSWTYRRSRRTRHPGCAHADLASRRLQSNVYRRVLCVFRDWDTSVDHGPGMGGHGPASHLQRGRRLFERRHEHCSRRPRGPASSPLHQMLDRFTAAASKRLTSISVAD